MKVEDEGMEKPAIHHRKTDGKTDRQTNRQTDKQMDQWKID